MKKLWFLFSILISLTAISQSSVKIFAYSQTVTPGIIPKGVTDENGNPVKTKKESAVNYYIFAVYPASAKLCFGEIWIKGKFYAVQTHKIDSTPVINVNENIPGNPIKEVLVPFTRSKVISIVPGKTMNSSISRTSWFRNMTKRNKLIVSYMYGGKKYFIGVKKIKPLQYAAGL
jgi:hypothetical protein